MNPTLSVLDLVPIRDGSDARQALADSTELARRVEEFGYGRIWLAEHHFAALASSAPGVVAGHILAATRTIRVGAGAVQLGQRVAAHVAEEWGTLATLYPGRVDLGLGRSATRGREYQKALDSNRRATSDGAPRVPDTEVTEHPTIDGVVFPEPRDLRGLVGSPRSAAGLALVTPGGEPPDFAAQVRLILDLLAGRVRPEHLSEPLHLTPGEHSDLQPWLLGNSPGVSAQLAGELGLPFVANYHLAPGQTIETARAYRAAFRPGILPEPHLAVSVDVLAADDPKHAARQALPFLPWVDSVASGRGAIPVPHPDDVRSETVEKLTRRHSARVATRLVGIADEVTARLATLARHTEADELFLTTLTRDPEDRVRSYQLIAKAWS